MEMEAGAAAFSFLLFVDVAAVVVVVDVDTFPLIPSRLGPFVLAATMDGLPGNVYVCCGDVAAT